MIYCQFSEVDQEMVHNSSFQKKILSIKLKTWTDFFEIIRIIKIEKKMNRYLK